MRYVAAAVLAACCCSIPCAFGAIPTLTDVEHACEMLREPMGECIRHEFSVAYQAEGLPATMAQELFTTAPLDSYFRWLDEHARSVPASGPARARVLRLIRAKTADAMVQATRQYAGQCAAMVVTGAKYAMSLQQQLSQAQSEIAQLEKAQADQRAKDARIERAIELLKLMNAATGPPPSAMPYVTCTSHPSGDGTSVTCY